jgi:hypothetical protein
MVNPRLEEIAQKIKSKERISNEEFQILVKNTDWKGYTQRLIWSLNEPRCSCDSCYASWFEAGEEIYKDYLEAFQKRKEEALVHLKNKKAGREFDRKRYEQEREKYACCSA